MTKLIAAATLFLGLATSRAIAGDPITLDSLLKEMTNREAIARFPDPAYTCKQFSSYDRKSTTPDDPKTWFANGDANKYLRVEDAKTADGKTHKEWVMADMDGPGAIVRIWSANPAGTLRIYLDNSDKPVIEAPMDDLLGGRWKVAVPLSQECSKGWNLYLPDPLRQALQDHQRQGRLLLPGQLQDVRRGRHGDHSLDHRSRTRWPSCCRFRFSALTQSRPQGGYSVAHAGSIGRVSSQANQAT